MPKIRMNYPENYMVQVPSGGRKRVRAKRHNRMVKAAQDRMRKIMERKTSSVTYLQEKEAEKSLVETVLLANLEPLSDEPKTIDSVIESIKDTLEEKKDGNNDIHE